jgi:predicted transport protein
MDKATQTMIENLHKDTGKTLEEWIRIVNDQKLTKYGDMLKFLKEGHSLTHGFANLIVLKAKGSDAGSVENKDDLISKQYHGKEHFKPMYDKLLSEILLFGEDIEIAPKNAYVSLRRKKQFAILHPVTKTRFEVGINLKGQLPEGKLEVINSANSMCSHRINLADIQDIDEEVIEWIKTAYNNAG